MDDAGLAQGARPVVFELFAAVADQIVGAGVDVAASRSIHRAVLNQQPHRLSVAAHRDLDPTGSLLVEQLDKGGAQSTADRSRDGDPPVDKVLEALGLAGTRARDDDRVPVDRTHDLQSSLGAVARVGENVGEGRDPRDIGLARTEGLDHRGVARRDLRAQGETAVSANEARKLISAPDQGALLDRRHEEHLHRFLAAHLELRAVTQTPDEGNKNRLTISQPTRGIQGDRLIAFTDGGQRSTPALVPLSAGRLVTRWGAAENKDFPPISRLEEWHMYRRFAFVVIITIVVSASWPSRPLCPATRRRRPTVRRSPFPGRETCGWFRPPGARPEGSLPTRPPSASRCGRGTDG